MRDASKVTDQHRARLCAVYVRQSSYAQVERNREPTTRQYDLVARAAELGWPKDAVMVIDEDLGLSGSGAVHRAGFARLAAEVGLGHVGIVLSIEVSRLARSNADWYRLLDLCAMTGTLIADTDGIYDPADYTDRLALGLKGTIAEAELHVLRERLHGGDPQQSCPGRAAHRPAGRAGLGRKRRGGALAPRRGGARRHKDRLRPLRRARLGACHLDLVPGTRAWPSLTRTTAAAV